MRRISRISGVAVTTGVALAAMGLSSPAYAAAESMHRGTTGCFNWSWADGVSTTTVYYSNTCDRTASINIWWQDGSTSRMKKVTAGAGEQGSVKNSGTVKRID
ncbi:hypothetical protein Slala03_38160 [Streptomyces lavendulae subsp. lavendulae]|uniref:hypothetical protein n=1 Tax=Streptomyces lavendulae TaxID=1914 RepID=UPI0024A5C077|nr:hypothetical protein [Streptomyces lavendulae]GLV84127.1 hypothetical protein Slala03_38160 [Streptomyces lavendulae subsp. lavendulae]